MFDGSVEYEKSTLSNRSKELFTLSGIFYASKLLLRGKVFTEDQIKETIISYWNAVAENMTEWTRVKQHFMSPDVFRHTFVCAHAIMLKALGEIGNSLVSSTSEKVQWRNKLAFLQNINWNKDSAELQGLVTINGRISSSQNNQRAFAEYLVKKSGWDVKVNGDMR